jgi:hypothetical protein
MDALRRAAPDVLQKRTLRQLLRDGAQTRFAKDHDLHADLSVEAYQARVPLRDYDAFWHDYWQKPFPHLVDQTWPGEIPFFAVSSGTTTGRNKYIPLTRRMIRQQQRIGLHVMAAHMVAHPDSRCLGGKTLMIGGTSTLTEEAPGIRSGDLSGILAATVPAYYRAFAYPPRDIAGMTDWDQKLDRLVEAVGRDKVTILGGIPSWLLVLFDRLEERYPTWPLDKLELLVHGGVPWTPYERRFQPFLEKSGAATREVYPASEGFIAFADATPEDGLMLAVDGDVFFEFVPVDELGADRPTRHWARTIETGVNYAVILTTAAGLWSYIIGDTVTFVSTAPPRLKVTGRTAYMLSVFGEHLIEAELEQAVNESTARADIDITDFMVGAHLPDAAGEVGRHVFLIESAQPVEPSDGLAETVAKDVDRVLAALNEDYKAHRSDGVGVTEPELVFLPPGRFADWMRRRGKFGGQNKVPRVIADPSRFEEIRQELMN